MNNQFPIGTPLTFVWRFLTPDKQKLIFDPSQFGFKLRYVSGRGVDEINTFVINPTHDGVTWTFPADEQVFAGEYGLILEVSAENQPVCKIRYNNAFSLYTRGENAVNTDATPAEETVELLSVGEFYFFTPHDGLSAYEVAVQNGYHGTEEEWLNDPVNGIKGVGIAETEYTESTAQSGVSVLKMTYNTGEEHTINIKNGTGIEEVEGTESSASSGTNTWIITLSDGTEYELHTKNGKGVAAVTQETTGVGSDAPNIIRVSYSDGTSDTFTVKNGAQGNSGYTGAAGELEVVNNLSDGGAAKALSAEMGKTLLEYIRDGYDWRGVATPGGTPDTIMSGHKVFYLANTPGTYTNYGGVVLNSKYTGIIRYDGNGTWSLTSTSLPSQLRVNLASRGVYLDVGHLIEITEGGGYDDYGANTSYDCLWVKIPDNCTALRLSGCVTPGNGARHCYFSGYYPTSDSYISYNRTGLVPAGAKLCIINLVAADNTDGYEMVNVEASLDYLKKSYFDSIFTNYLVSIPSGKNHIDADNVLNGFIISDGKVKAKSGGVMSNRIFLVDGLTYTMSGIPYYGTANKIFYANYRADGTVVSIKGLSCTHDSGYGTATFTFSSNGGQIDHIRICLDSVTSADFDPSIAQLELGDTATAFAAYTGSDKLDVDWFGCVDGEYFDSLFDNYIRTVPLGKNYFDPEKFLPGYQLNNGQIVANAHGILSNKLFLENGKTYTFQGVPYYSTTGYCYLVMYDTEGNLISGKKLTKSDPGATGFGTGSFKFSSNNGQVAYCRFVLQASTSTTLVADNVQLELGEEATDVEDFIGKDVFVVDSGGGGDTPLAERRKVRVLCIGNSYTGDEMYYVPFLMPSLADLDVEVGYLYRSGENLAGHWSNFQNDTTYSFYVYRGKGYWETIGSRTIKQALAFQQWDIITLQQQQSKTYTWSTYQPYLNNLINGIFNYLTYPVKFVWVFGQQCPYYNGQPVSDEVMIQRLQQSWANSQRVLNETLCDAVIPVGTAVQNARTTSLKNLGDYGNLCEDGVHLQDGLPRQIAAYTVCMTLLDLCGFSDRSVYGDTNRVTEEWLDGKNVQQRQGDAIGSNDANCQIAQKCVVMAHKHPYQITDISQL